MAFRIEYGHQAGSPFYEEIQLVERVSGEAPPTDGVDHRLVAHACQDWRWGTVLASNGNGLITVPAPGLLVISIPWDRFTACGPWGGDCCSGRAGRSLRFSLVAVPSQVTDAAQVLARGTISFGDR